MNGKNSITALFLFLCVAANAQPTERKYLSGTGSDDAVPWSFFCTEGRNAGKWTTINVPSCWELQGFGKYDYGFAKDSVRGKEKGMYRYTFEVPSAWKEKLIRIVFEGVMTDTEIKVNGQAAGPVHRGAYYAFAYEITQLLRPGEKNLLEVTVAKHSANESVNDAERRGDFWIFGGIFRPVYLEALPRQHIHHIGIDATANGELKAAIKFAGAADKVTVQLFRQDGMIFGKEQSAAIRNTSEVMLNARYTAPKLWTPESPDLYRAEFSLYNKGKRVHTVSRKIGFRTVEVRQRDGVYVNGVQVKMKGVNRHSFRPETGRTTSRSISLEDVLLMKDMNMNAVRMSHYPPDDHFLDVCDSLGLFVMDELAGWHGMYDSATGAQLVREMIEHDAHHPSIIFWANGNEGGHNTALDPLFAQYDLQKRPVLHPWQSYGGFDTQHYREYNYGIGNYDQGHEIVMPTEFLHGLYDGGHGAGLEDYWELMWRKPLSAGGFLWDFADQGVVRTDKNGMIDTDGNHGADGIVGPHQEKEGSYFAIKEIWSPVFMEEKEITPQFDGVLRVENRYHYTNLRDCRFGYQLKKFKTQGRIINGNIPSPLVKPGEKGRLKMDLPADWQQFDVLYVTATDPFKRELFTWSFPLKSPGQTWKAFSFPGPAKRPELMETDSVFQVSVQGLQVRIHKNKGLLLEVKREGKLIPFTNGPVVQEGSNHFKNFSQHYDGNNLVIASAFDRKEQYHTLKWTIYPSGLIGMELRYFPAAYFTTFSGVNFTFPEQEIKSVTYMGYGPYRVWKNRMKGNTFGVWNKTYNATETGEAPWAYPEFKGYYKGLRWCTFHTTGKPFTVYTEQEDVFLRLFTPAFKTDPWKNYEPIFPAGDLSFMQGIPGIGTKTQRAETTGPMGMKYIFYDYEKDPARSKTLTLYFNFLENE